MDRKANLYFGRIAPATIALMWFFAVCAGFNTASAQVPSPPSILSPGVGFPPGIDINTTTPWMFWQESPGATHYGLYISIAPYGSQNIVYQNENVPAGFSFQVPSGFLFHGNLYRWNMVAKNVWGESVVSNTLYFKIPPGAFTLSNQQPYCDTNPPIGPAVQLNWTAAIGATSYDVYRNGNLYASGITGTSFLNNANLNAGQTYSYFIRANSAAGFTDSNTVNVSIPSNVCASPPGQFTFSNNPPICDGTNSPAVFLSWTASSGATSYTIFRNGSVYISNYTLTTFYDNFNLTAGQTYTYFVQAVNSAGTTNSNTVSVPIPSNICTDQGQDPPGEFTLSNQPPVCDTETGQPAVMLNWTASEGATSYDAYRNGSFYASAGTNLSFYNSANVVAGQTYSYFIRASNSTGTIDSNSVVVSITSGICDGVCPNREIADCNGNCAPAEWVGDGFCDNGADYHNGIPIHFDCPQFDNDGGDCNVFYSPTGASNPPSPPDYGFIPEPAADENNLIVVTHGWATKDSTLPDSVFNTFWKPLADTIRDTVGSEWQVIAYDWTTDSGKPGALSEFGPVYALFMGAAHGHQLGMEIGQSGYDHVHLIAHSAGSALISTASYWIKEFSPGTTVHTTYLDAFAGMILVGGASDWKEVYGGFADWSDHYFSRDKLLLPICTGTGKATQLHLPKAFNLDVTFVDPDYGALCQSSHSWPRCFYSYTVTETAVDACPGGDSCCKAPISATGSYGFPLSYAKWPGELEEWVTHMNLIHPKDSWDILPPSGTAGSDDDTEDNLVWYVRNDVAINLNQAQMFMSDVPSVELGPGAISMTTAPDGDPAWVNIQTMTNTHVNVITFDVAFTSDPTADGIVTVYVNDVKRGFIDETYTVGTGSFAIPTPGDLDPGQHVIGFRLDQFGQQASSVSITNIATAWAGFVPEIVVPGEFATIQEAIDTAVDGSIVSVEPGTYFENINLKGKAITLHSTDGPNVTIIDAQGKGTVITCNSGEGPDTIIDGFTITGGTGTPTDKDGGGLYIVDSSPAIKNCIIKENLASTGAGMWFVGGNAVVTNCTFEANETTGRGAGGGMWFGSDTSKTSIFISDTVFINNYAAKGGGMYSYNSAAVIVNSFFGGNSASNGGGIGQFNSNLIVDNTVFEYNVAKSGGGIHGVGNSMFINNSMFDNNSSFTTGGAMRIGSGTAEVCGSTFRNNWAAGPGGGVMISDSAMLDIGTSSFCANSPDHISGSWADHGGNFFATASDLNCDGVVNGLDLVQLLGAWGPCADCDDCPADLNGDCVVNGFDLVILLSNWG